MIKQIQLRGISRTPSDRMTADGGCAESLNVHIADNELSPTLAPEDVTGDLGLPLDSTKGYIYIHEGNGYTNYITLNGQEIGAFVRGVYESIASMVQGETIQTVTSIGNTLIVMGSDHPYYALFKDGHYVFLGGKIPFPTIRLMPEPVDVNIRKVKVYWKNGSSHSSVNHIIPASDSYDKNSWNEKAREAEKNGKRFAGVAGIPDPEPGEEETPDYMTGMKEFVQEAYANAKEESVLINQVMALYGVRLYNGSYITSVPFLMPGGFESPFFCRLLRYSEISNGDFSVNAEYVQYGARYPYRIKAKMLDFDEQTLKLWSDIIMSIDFFITPDIPFDMSEEKVMYVKQEYKPSSNSSTDRFNLFELSPGSQKYARGYLNRILNMGSGDFRRVESMSTDATSYDSETRLEELREGTLLDINDYIVNQDLLQTQLSLADFPYDMANIERTAENASNMNNRLLMSGVTQIITSGANVFPAAPCYLEKKDETSLIPYIEESYRQDVSPVTTININEIIHADEDAFEALFPLGWSKSDFSFPEATKYVQIVYHILGQEKYTVRGRIGNSGDFVDIADGNIGYFGFLMFPDIRCRSVDIYVSFDNETWYKQNYEMREHPNLPCSYMYIGVDKNLFWDITDTEKVYDSRAVPTYWDFRDDCPPADITEIVENRVEKKDNSLLLSDMDTPWFVPLGNEYQMQATEIIGTALATKALSTGQFGQFPLYVFTDNGIWAMQMNSLGTFSSSHAVSMEVAKKGTILSLDQAVVFLTDKGVMMLTGSDIQNLSPYMNGKHYIVENSATALLNRSIWSGLIDALVDGSHFMNFMEGAMPAYDYAGERIIFFNKDKTYMYVYMLRTTSWHKSSLPEGVLISRPLNSYPETLMSATNTGYARLLDFSTALDVTSGDNIKAVIATRPMDLGEPDIRKTIKSIRIRGQYNRNDVQYILLGSMDGINWGVLPSLRGGSYKLYRIILLANLSPTERISWIDIDYESRFANKLR